LYQSDLTSALYKYEAHTELHKISQKNSPPYIRLVYDVTDRCH